MVQTRHGQREEAAKRIQTAFRQYTHKRYASWATNWDDRDPISLEPIKTLPRIRLFRMRVGVHMYAYDSWAWLRWIYRSETHPISRKLLTIDAICACYNAARASADVLSDTVPDDVKSTLAKYENPVSIRNVSIVSVRPVRWYMLVYISPLYKLLYLNVEICGTSPPYANVSYDVEERQMVATRGSNISLEEVGATCTTEERTFIFASDRRATSQAEQDIGSNFPGSSITLSDADAGSEYDPSSPY